MPWESIRVRAPRVEGEPWLNVAPPPSMETLLAGGLLLVDFWEYSCINCLRTLPYLVAWHERYHEMGLEIVGIHTPEFHFSRQPEVVAAAVARLGIPYPVLLDNEQRLWQAFANRAWPSKYLIDAEGVIRYRAVGEGHYGESERAIQQLLRERHGAALDFPPLMAPLRPTDAPGAVCYRPTPELHAGGTWEQATPESERVEGRLYFEGAWHSSQEYAESAAAHSLLHLAYRAAEINAVLGTSEGQPLRLFLYQDGQPLKMGEAGEDVVVDSELGSYVTVSAPRLYNLAINPDFARHEITLEALAPGIRLFSFTFVSCTKPFFEEGDIVMP